MALRSCVRFILLTPIQITIFLAISFPLAFFAAVTTFFSVIFLSSRLFLVYVDLLFSVIFFSPPNGTTVTSRTNTTANTTEANTRLRLRRSPHPLTIPRSPPRSPPRSGGNGGYKDRRQQSFTAPSSPNISRKRLSAGAYGQQQQQQQQIQYGSGNSSGSSRQASLSPPLTMKGAATSSSNNNSGNPTPHTYDSGNGRSKGGKKGPVKIAEPGDDYFFGVGSRS
ncbi:hypothetical protein AA313_de0210282 [Arthrobotrys entomopaga]|nr:hypothetical protein AA313_de0210282 [Arthrobotrys entomopaga]